jgi:prephenate dehydratase
MALVELGLRGANLSRIESRPTDRAWSYRFFVDIEHLPGRAGFERIFQPPAPHTSNVVLMGTYRRAREV